MAILEFKKWGNHRRIQDFLGGLRDKSIRMCTYCTAVKTQLLHTQFIPQTFWLNRIVTISQTYWDGSGAEVAITIQKLFSNLSDLKKVTGWLSKKIIICKTNTGPPRENAWGRHKSDKKIHKKKNAASSLCWLSVQAPCRIMSEIADVHGMEDTGEVWWEPVGTASPHLYHVLL